MKRTVIVEAKKYEDALNDGLRQLGVPLDEASVKTISPGGLFRKVKLEVSTGSDDPPPAPASAVPAYKPPVSPLPPVQATNTGRDTEKSAPKSGYSAVRNERPAPAVGSGGGSDKPAGHGAEKPAVNPADNAGRGNAPGGLLAKLAASKPGANTGRGSAPASNQAKRVDKLSAVSDEPPEFLRPPRGSEKFKRGNGGRGDRPGRQDKPFNKSASEPSGADSEEKRNFRRREETHEPGSPEAGQKAEGFLAKVLELSGIPATLATDLSDGIAITIEAQEPALIGHRGETLDALQYLTSLIVNSGEEQFTRVSLDALGYRARRAETLRKLAAKMAEKALRQSRRVTLEAMNNSDRKEIHAFLSEFGGVYTRSEGSEPNRRIVIYPKK
ncbi:MAG: hypothetical protein FWD58_02450 [Firmicutes bacterium]|nr:hypothetical protein [Bacillota bacterium]